MSSPLSDRERIDAARCGDTAAREQLVTWHLPMVRRVAAAYRGFGLPYEDLVQEGSIGLLEAIDRYDESRGLDFESYARFRIRRSIRNALTEKARLIRLPKQIVERRRAIERAELRLRAAGTAAPTPAAIAASLGMAEPAIREARSAPVAGVSLEAAVLPDGSPLEELIADEEAPDPQRETTAHERDELVDAAVAALPARQREIVARHFGVGRQAERLCAVADSLHLSPQRTRTIERSALYALRKSLEEEELLAPSGGRRP